MTISRPFLLLLTALLQAESTVPASIPPVAPPIITGYTRFIGKTADRGRSLIVLRKGEMDGAKYGLVADPSTLTTEWRPLAGLTVTNEPWDTLKETFRATPYLRALRTAEANSDTLHDAGLTHVPGARSGTVLTVDLCPAQKPMDRNLFLRVREAFSVTETPVPIGLSITGSWVRQHPEDFEWLLAQVGSRRIAPLWINHSFHHRTDTAQPAKSKYLLDTAVNLDEEILGTEKMLLAHDQRPSIFFRFPGLVSDRALFDRVTAYGLIPVGSDAWLSKNETPSNGSIILIHGNGNEPYGVRKFLALLDAEKTCMKKGTWRLWDLREGILAEDSGRAP
ncbi:MAG: polysaccharide deacetylase [Fibrobacterota bacterium]